MALFIIPIGFALFALMFWSEDLAVMACLWAWVVGYMVFSMDTVTIAGLAICAPAVAWIGFKHFRKKRLMAASRHQRSQQILANTAVLHSPRA